MSVAPVSTQGPADALLTLRPDLARDFTRDELAERVVVLANQLEAEGRARRQERNSDD